MVSKGLTGWGGPVIPAARRFRPHALPPDPSLRAKRSNPSGRKESMDCFAALAMTGRAHFHLPAARFARGFHIVSPKQEGAGNAGCLLHPRSRVQEMVVNAHTSIQVQPEHSDIPRAMVLRLMARSPWRRIRLA